MRRLAAGRLMSIAGSDATGVAVGFALYEQTHSAAWLSASLLLTVGISGVFAPLGGWLGDRMDRRRLMIACEVGAAFLFAALACFHGPALLLGVGVLATLLGGLFGPAAGAAMASIAGEVGLARANGSIATGANVGRTIGRLGAGGLVALIGPGAVFLVDAATFALSAGLTASIRCDFGGYVRAARTRVRPGAGITAGVRRLLGDPVVRPIAISASVSTLATSFSMTAEVPLVFHLHAGAIGLGALTAAWGLGMAVGSRAGGRRLHRGNEATGVLAGRVTMALGIGLVFLAPNLPFAIACYLLGGLGGGFMGVAAQSLVVRETPADARSSVLGAMDACRNIAFAVGVVAAGALVAVIGPHEVYGLVGLVVLLGCLPLAALVRNLGGVRPLRPAPAARPAPASVLA